MNSLVTEVNPNDLAWKYVCYNIKLLSSTLAFISEIEIFNISGMQTPPPRDVCKKKRLSEKIKGRLCKKVKGEGRYSE